MVIRGLHNYGLAAVDYLSFIANNYNSLNQGFEVQQGSVYSSEKGKNNECNIMWIIDESDSDYILKMRIGERIYWKTKQIKKGEHFVRPIYHTKLFPFSIARSRPLASLPPAVAK